MIEFTKVKNFEQEYYLENVMCECGCIVRKQHLKRHLIRKIHFQNMNKNKKFYNDTNINKLRSEGVVV